MRTLTPDQKRVKDLVEAFDTPIVFHPGGWADTLPDWLKLRVIKERVDMLCNGGWDKATDAEVTCYLYTAALTQALGSDWTEITLYQAAKQVPHLREALPATPKELSDYQRHELDSLKCKIRDSQIRLRKSNRKEKDMSKRKLVMEEHDGSVLVGVMQEGCDPFVRTMEGAIEQVMATVPDFLKEAQDKWAVSPKNPAYVAPAEPKATKAAAATPAQPPKAADLPLLAGTEKAAPAEAKAEEQAAAPAEEPAVAPATEEKPAEAEAEVTQPPAEPAEAEPEPAVPPAEPEAVETVESGVVEEETEQAISERIATAPAPPAAEPEPTPVPAAPSTTAKAGEWEYVLQDGRGPFGSVQEAMDAMGMDKNTRPQHNRWDRLSTALKEKIQRRPKS